MAFVIFIALLGVPLIEIGIFIDVGGRIGLWPTLALILGTAVAGTALLHHQGLSTLERARETVTRGEIPLQEVADGACLVIAGALLLTPGFLTDAIGGMLLFPPARHFVQRWILGRIAKTYRPQRHNDVIDAEYTNLGEDTKDHSEPDDRIQDR